MSRVLSLALKITGDASGVRLTPVERALKRLGEETDKVGKVFDRFAKTTEAGQRAQQKFADDSQRLTEALKSGAINSREYAEQFARLAEAANTEAAALERAARITEASLTPLERFDRAQAELTEQLNAGRISQETYARATESAAKGLTDAERAARGFAVQQNEIENAASNTTLKFNELSGVFAVLPGPLGNIAGRISGISSAGEGLSRIFAGGLRQGVSNLAGSFTALVNPVTLALGAITGLAAGATSVVRGLVNLEARVETLSRLANQLGVSFEFVQVLEEAGRRADVSVEQLSGSFARLQNTLASTDAEGKKAGAALQRLGVSVEDFGRLSEQQRIDLIGERLAAIEDPAQRSAAAIALFGRSGVQLLPFFNELGGAASDIETFGAAISDTQRSSFERLGASFDQVGVSLRGLGQSVLTPFIGIVEGLARTFAGLINVVTGVAQAIGAVLGPVLNEFGGLFGGVADGINATVGFFRSFFVSTDTATEKTKQLVETTKQVKIDPTPVREYEKAITSVTERVRQAREESERFGIAGRQAGEAYAITIRQLNEEFRDGRIRTLDGLKVAIDQATQAYQQQIGVIREAAEEERRRAEAERNTVQELIDGYNRANLVIRQFGGDESRARAADNLRSVYAEAERVEKQLAAARKAGDEDAAFALQERLETLAAIAIREEGIASGAAAAREKQRQEAQAAIAERERLDKEARDRRIQAERQAEQQLANERQRVNNLVNEQLALAQFGGDSQRLAASRNVQAIQAEIARVEAEVERARRAGNTQAAQAGAARIAQLDQVVAKERDIASGRAAKEAEIAKRREEAAAREKQLIEQASKQREEAVRQQQAAAQQQQEAQKKAFEEQSRAAAEEADRQDRRIRSLNSIGQQSIGVGDLRSTDGANQFIQAAAGAFDPNLAELRAQSKLLRQIVLNSGALQFLERGVGSTFQFLGGGA